MAFSDVFQPKIINKQHKGDGAPLVALQDRRGSALVEAMLGDAF